MEKQIQFVQVTPEQLQSAIIEGVKIQLDNLKEHFQPKEPNEYLTRKEVAKMLSIDLSTLWNWQQKSIVHPRQIGGRILFLRSEIEQSIVELKN